MTPEEIVQRRQRATEAGFVSIPTGHAWGIPTFMTGMWYGDRNHNGCPLVEFLVEKDESGYHHAVRVVVVESAMLIATDEEIAEAADGRNGLIDTGEIGIYS